MLSDGSDPLPLTDYPADDWISSWSPDGNQIVFESKRDGNYEIYVMNADGKNQQRLTDHPAHDGFPSWSPDGTQIAFMSKRDGNYEIYIMPAPGSQMEPDRTEPQRLTINHVEDFDPSWSPDGEWLAFVSNRDGNDEIYTMRVDSSSVHQLTDPGAQNWSPAWQLALVEKRYANTWVKKFEGGEYGAFFDIILTPDGNALAVGTTNHLHKPPYTGDGLIQLVNGRCYDAIVLRTDDEGRIVDELITD